MRSSHFSIQISHKRLGYTAVELLTVFGIISLLLSLLIPAIMSVRSRARNVQCLNRLKQIGLAQHAAVDAHGAFPTSRLWIDPNLRIETPKGLQRLTSLIQSDTSAFICPADQRGQECFRSPTHWRNYHLNDGTRFHGRDRNGFRTDNDSQLITADPAGDTTPGEISDGLSQTAAVSERLFASSNDSQLEEAALRADPTRYFWYTPKIYPDELSLAAACEAVRTSPFPLASPLSVTPEWGYDHLLTPNRVGCVNGPWVEEPGSTDSKLIPPTSQHGGYVNVLFADGAVHSVTDYVNIAVWRALGTSAGGETATFE